MLQLLFGESFGGGNILNYNYSKDRYYMDNEYPYNFTTKKLDDKFVINVAMPGYKKEWIDISIKNNNQIMIHAKIPESKKDNMDLCPTEVNFTIPVDVDYNISNSDYINGNNIDAKLEDGILTITFKKIKPKVKQIKIK